MIAQYQWRRTALTRADGAPVPDDWCLVDPQLGPIARIYRVTGGPRDGNWFWAVQIDKQGRPWNGGTGYCPSGREAKEAVEARMAALRREA
jgi:hypothetical protein